MADKHPDIVQGSGASLDDDRPAAAQSAQDRKAASALASLDAADASHDAEASPNMDRAAVDKAMRNLAAAKPSAAAATATDAAKKTTTSVKVDAAHVALLIHQLDLSRPKATDLLKQNQADPVLAMRAFVNS
ncbi:hypothetical protein CDD82_4654 [Ophiocordyceps australis]|uniref:Nascent polypeptide-associated complex subunit alpha-like UBA domain-containing protein n=1 Tax=Ophiocordyceps australis TaxID=1399860 RepID=A0A2C5ZUY4_9HYPO|nr:hypothetical protein CDD82_4654 [Ophiocordyceps australis]